VGKRIVIIGGGVAGLSAGIYGRKNGFDTEIIEMHNVTGGQCTAWVRKGYSFDYCLHWLVGTGRGPFLDIWKDTDVLNESTEVMDHEVYAKITDSNNESFFIYADIDRWEQYLMDMAPEDIRAIKKMCRTMRKGTSLMPFGNPPELLGIGDYAKALFSMFPVLMVMGKYKGLTCVEYFDKLKFKNEKLKHFLYSYYGGRDFSALAFLMMLAFFNQKNAGYIKGGSFPLAQRMTERYLSLGGKLNMGKKVVKIRVEDNRARGVELADGTLINADYVISAADGHTTLFSMLGGKYLTGQLKKAYAEWELFLPLVQVSFGISKSIAAAEPITLYVEKDIFIGSTKLPYGYSIMNYSFDPTMAPEGKSVILLRYESPWEVWENMDKETYKKEKEKILADASALMEKRYPGISDVIEVTDVATPLTDVKYTGVWKGSYEGFMPSAKNFNKTLKMNIPGLENFYMAGQRLYPGGGLPPSAQSGRWAVQLICRKEKMKFISGTTH
jgi:phytoene dehydrogenase-like protein